MYCVRQNTSRDTVNKIPAQLKNHVTARFGQPPTWHPTELTNMSKPNHVINDDELNQFPRCATRQRSPEIDAEEGQDPKRDNADDGHSSHHIGNVHARTEEGHNQTKQTTRLLAKQNKNNPDIDLGNHASTKTTPITTESTMSPEETCQKWKKSTQLRTRRWFRLEGKQTETEPTTPSSPDRLKARGGPSQLCHAATTVPEIGLSHNLNMTHHLTGPLQVISYLISRQ